MKVISNRKTWDDIGWTYSMRRVINGVMFSHGIIISKYEMHYRNGVAAKLRKARFDLHIAIMREKYPELFKPA